MRNIVYRMRWLFAIFLVTCIAYSPQAQNLDSLRRILSDKNLPDTTRVLALSEYAYDLRRMLPDSSLLLATEALQLSEKINYTKGKGRAIRIIGISHYLRSEYPPALGYYEQALQFSLAANDIKNIANCYNNIGTIYHGQSEYKKALAIFSKSLAIRERIGDQRGVAQAYANMAGVYQDQSNYDEALDMFKKSLVIYERLKDPEGIASSYRNIGTVYHNYGNSEEALRYFLISLEKRKNMNDDRYGMAFLYNDLGTVYKERGDYEKALEYFFNALRIQEGLGSKQGIAASHTHIGNIYRDQGNYEKALGYLTSSLRLKEEIGSKTGIANSYTEIGSLHRERRQFAQATENYLKSLTLREAIGDRRGLALMSARLAEIAILTSDYPQALSYLQRGLKTMEQIKSDPVVCDLYIGYASYYNAIHKPQLAYDYAKKSLALADKINNIEYLRNAFGQKSIAAEALGKYKEALEDHKHYLLLNDSVQNLNSIKKSLALDYMFKEERAKIEAEKKELELRAATERQKRITYTFAGVAIAFIMISLVVWRSSYLSRKANRVLTTQKQEIEKVNDELAKADSIKNKLLSIISHDVRSPLNTLKGILDLFNNNALSQEELKEVTANVGDQVTHLNYFLDNLLRWSRTQMNESSPQYSAFSMASLVKDGTDLMSSSAHAKKITIKTDMADDLLLYADEEMMKCVLRNLLSNAIKFSHENSSVTISAESRQTYVIISVQDAGTGIEADELPHLFETNHLSTKGTRDEMGTGLGLVLCKEFVEKNGGSITATSQSGKGSCFSFTVRKA